MDDQNDIKPICGKGEQSSETMEITEILTYQTERERNIVYTLLHISEKSSEEDGKYMDYYIQTGWEEAIHGWGRASPFACLHPQKKPKKTRSGEAIDHCALCLDMVQVPDKRVTQETKSTAEYTKADFRSSARAKTDTDMSVVEDLSRYTDEKVVNVSGVLDEAISNCLNASEASKQDTCDLNLYMAPPFQAEIKQVKKEDVQYQEKSQSHNVIRSEGKKKDVHQEPVSREALAFTCFSVLPPVKATIPSDFIDLSVRKSKAITVRNEENILENTSAVIPGHNHVGSLEMQGDELTTEKLSDALRGQLKGQNVIPAIVPLVPVIPLLHDRVRWYWQCSIMPGKINSVIHNASTSKQHEHSPSVGLLHARTIQHCKRNLKRDEITRAPFSTSGKSDNGNEQKQRNRTGGADVAVISEPLLPPLSVTRVAIPVVPYRLL